MTLGLVRLGKQINSYFLHNFLLKNTNSEDEYEGASANIFNLGAIVGIPVQGYFSSRFGLKKSIGVLLLITAVLPCDVSSVSSISEMSLIENSKVPSSFICPLLIYK